MSLFKCVSSDTTEKPEEENVFSGSETCSTALEKDTASEDSIELIAREMHMYVFHLHIHYINVNRINRYSSRVSALIHM